MEEETASFKSVKRSSRRTIAEMRKEMIDNDGVFLDWSNKIKKEAQNNTPELLNAFNTVSEKGFIVFETGCIIPHPYYSKKGKDGPARFRGHKVSIGIFKSSKNFESKDTLNEDGWPLKTEISHLCHFHACMNPDHLIYEPRWKNWKRHYCFGCDCNMKPSCLMKFHPSTYWDNEENHPRKVGYDNMKELKNLLPSHVKILPKDHFKKDDIKAKNRFKRLKKKRKQSKQSKRKAKYLSKIKLTKSSK